MISTILAIFALVGAVAAAPVSQRISEIAGMLPGGAGFKGKGTTTAGASSNGDAGVSAAGLSGIGSVLSLSGPGAAFGFARESPQM